MPDTKIRLVIFRRQLGVDKMICGGGLWFFPLCKLFFSLLTRNKPFLPLRQRNKQIFFPHITPFFCQFCEQTFYFLHFAEQTIFSSLLQTIFFFFKKTPHSPPPCIIWSAPWSSKCRSCVLSYPWHVASACV